MWSLLLLEIAATISLESLYTAINNRQQRKHYCIYPRTKDGFWWGGGISSITDLFDRSQPGAKQQQQKKPLKFR